MESKEFNFIKEIKSKFKKPWKQSAFIGYFVLSLILALIAIFAPIFEIKDDYYRAITASISTFFLASIVSSIVDLNLSFTTLNKASFSIYTILVLVISMIVFMITFILSDFWRLFPSIFGFLLAFFIWVISNSDKDVFDDKKYAKKLKSSINDTNNYNDMLDKISDNNEK
jgi:hypothetical protein